MASLKSYEDWRHCITQLCGIPLDGTDVERRLAELRDPTNHATWKFLETWGDEHHRRVVAWFEQARGEMAETSPTSAVSGTAG